VLINNEPVVVPETVNFPFGVVVPIPILLPDWNIIELDIVLEELNKAILWVVPGPTGANEALLANDDVIETEAVVAKEAVPVNEPDMEPVSPAPINVIPLLDTSNDPVITALPEKGNPAPLPPPEPLNVPKNDPENEPEYTPNPAVDPPESTSIVAAEDALDAEVANDELKEYDADIANDELKEYDADVANDDDIDTLLLCAQLLVPNTDPVSPLPTNVIPLLDTNNEPVITALPLNGNPGVAFKANDAVTAFDAVPKNEPEYIPNPVVEPPLNTSTVADDDALEADIAKEDVNAYDADIATGDVSAYDADVANEDEIE
jgi:hypothetical protein